VYEQGSGMRELQITRIKIMRLAESWVIYGRFASLFRADFYDD